MKVLKKKIRFENTQRVADYSVPDDDDQYIKDLDKVSIYAKKKKTNDVFETPLYTGNIHSG